MFRGPDGVRTALWSSLAVFRWVSLAYAVVLLVRSAGSTARPTLAWALLGVMAAWTVMMSTVAPAADAHGRRGQLAGLVVGDIAVCAGMVLATRLVDGDAARSLPAVWSAGGVLSAALVGGTAGGLAGAVVTAVASMAERGAVNDSTVGSAVLLLLTGAVTGYLVRTALRAESALAAALADRAADAERERLARGVHDGALQALALIARQAERGLPTARVAQLAAEQEVALRRLVGARRASSTGSASGVAVPTVDVAGQLSALATPAAAGRPAVTVATPGMPVPLPTGRADEVVAAVRAALDNVARHAGPGAAAWVLVEEDRNEVVVTVRDNGVGMSPERPAEAVREGRLGLATSVCGRIRDLGGAVTVTTRLNEGTEVELHVPR